MQPNKSKSSQHLLLGSGSLLSLSLSALVTDTDQTGVGASETQTTESVLLTLGHAIALDVGDGVLGRDVVDGEGSADVRDVALGFAVGGEGGLGGVDFVSGRVELLELAALAGEEDQTGLVVLQAGDIGDQRFLGVVGAAVVDGNTDGGGEFLGNAGFLGCVSFCSGLFASSCRLVSKGR